MTDSKSTIILKKKKEIFICFIFHLIIIFITLNIILGSFPFDHPAYPEWSDRLKK